MSDKLKTEKEVLELIIAQTKLTEKEVNDEVDNIIYNMDNMVNRLGALFVCANNHGVWLD